MSALAPARVVRNAPWLRASSCALFEVDVARADGSVLALVRKDSSPARLLSDARRVRPRTLFDSRREADLYRLVLDPCRHGTARCFSVEPPAASPALLLERVDGAPLEELAFGPSWLAAARWLGRFHAEFAGRVPPLPALLDYRAAHFAPWPRRAAAQLAQADPAGAAWLASLAARYAPVAAALAAQPGTLVHGDFHPANIVVAAHGGRVCVVDWELAGRGPALLDLAALTSGDWTPERRSAVIAAYQDAACDWPAAAGEFDEALELCRLHLALQWLGWGPQWRPEQRRSMDWLAVARACADRLGL